MFLAAQPPPSHQPGSPPRPPYHPHLCGQMLVPKFTEAEVRRQISRSPRAGQGKTQPQNGVCQSFIPAWPARPQRGHEACGLPVPHRWWHPRNAKRIPSFVTNRTADCFRSPGRHLEAAGNSGVSFLCVHRRKKAKDPTVPGAPRSFPLFKC